MNLESKSIPIVTEGEGSLINPPDPEAFREWNRKKSKALTDKVMNGKEAIERFVDDGDYLGFELYGTVRCPMGLTRDLVRSGKKNFRIAGQGVHEADLLLIADLIREIDFTYIGLEVYGVSSCVRRAVESGAVTNIVEWSNAALTWRFKAASMGLPFLPTKSMLGTDTLRRSSAKVIECPFTKEKVALLPALFLDVGFIHVSRADKYGNCQIDGISGFAFEMSRASKKLIVSTEKIIDSSEIRKSPDRTIIPYYLVDAVVHHPFGSWPGEMAGSYERDEKHYRMFIEEQKTQKGAQKYLKEWTTDLVDHDSLLEKIGKENLDSLLIDQTSGGAR